MGRPKQNNSVLSFQNYPGHCTFNSRTNENTKPVLISITELSLSLSLSLSNEFWNLHNGH